MLTNILRPILNRNFKPFEFKKCDDNNNLDYVNLNNKDNLGLYIHIPFCKSICSFCPYNKVLYDEKMAFEYKEALLKEIKLANTRYKKQDITSLYFGGGTPALLIEYLEEIIDTVKENFNLKGSLAIELHPSNINLSLLNKLKSLEFNMISVGIQSFNKNCLENLGRKENNEAEKIKLVKEVGFETIDVDLIFGIPNQSIEDLKKDVTLAFEIGATQISTYPFIDFSYANNKRKPLTSNEKKKMLFELVDIAEKIGLDRTSVWTFAKPNTEKYSSITRENFIGLGPGAASLFDDKFRLNTFSVEEYINAVNENEFPCALVLNFTKFSRKSYWLFWNVYNMSLDKTLYKKMFDSELSKDYRFELSLAKKMNLLKEDEFEYKVTTKGSYYFHVVEQIYTLQYIDKTWSIAQNNPWPDKIKLY
ncbi:putative oxygen-independent coproporphyrinogen III oxidase [[Clostridium] sordellii]|uniref:coproporphyrinogen-III oxidase family protein n=1 Tax=Paraclostridium sordellii TaxID=1505 RepID=UPI0005E02D4F|nr:radical SAM protein [Paeniclostridium sordellii]CEQ10346.1 putative oxygen-independent coproporphyrinogen III oxidase [[Clostridium] sordellii] [Paeniclostridium sordellii]